MIIEPFVYMSLLQFRICFSITKAEYYLFFRSVISDYVGVQMLLLLISF